MKKLFLICLLLIMANFLFAYNITCEKGMDKYKPEVEKEFGIIITDVVKAREEVIKLCNKNEIMSREIAYLLGCEDREDYILFGLNYNLLDSDIICKTLNNIKIKSYEEAKKNHVLKTGYVNYEFTENDGVNLVFSPMIDSDNDEDFYLPILINKQGEIIKKKELFDAILTIGGNSPLKGPLMMLEDLNEFITQKMGISYPFSRWYNEGMNYKIISLALHKAESPIAQDFDKLFAVTEDSKKLRGEVNLWTFPQTNLVTIDDYPMDLSTANIQYSCELMDKIYGKIGREGIHKLNTEMKFSEMLTNPQICKMAKNVCNLDLESMLTEYIPTDKKTYLVKEKRDEVISQAEKCMNNKQYKEAIPLLSNVIVGDPYNLSIRLNLAKCYREEKNIIDSDKHIFIAANASIPGSDKISFFGEENVINIIIVGKYLFMSEVLDTAEEYLKVAYETDKSPDIKQILESIEITKENKRKELYGGN